MKAAIDMRRRALMVLMVAILAIAAAMTNGLTSAESAGTSFPFIVFAGPPGSPAQVYNGHYWGGTNWVENQYDNAFTSHQSEMIYDNGKDVEDPFTNVEIYHNGDFQFRVPATSFSPDPAFIPSGWHRQGGISHDYTVSITRNGTVDAKGNMGWRLCDRTGCYGGVWLQGEWDLW